MLNLCEAVLAANSQELLNSARKHAIVTMSLGMALPLGTGKRGSSGQRQGTVRADGRNSRPRNNVEQGKANGVRLL